MPLAQVFPSDRPQEGDVVDESCRNPIESIDGFPRRYDRVAAVFVVIRQRVQQNATAQYPREFPRAIAIRDVPEYVKFQSNHGMRSESEENRGGRESASDHTRENYSQGEYLLDSRSRNVRRRRRQSCAS